MVTLTHSQPPAFTAIQPSHRVHLRFERRQMLLMMQAVMEVLAQEAQAHGSQSARVGREMSRVLREELLTEPAVESSHFDLIFELLDQRILDDAVRLLGRQLLGHATS